ncbi:DUF3987 domain-containing protein [Paracoccus sp. MC1854]|uniref:DUF3987 domain-containing protein n=1 Tax=Paracoccus sp. MC1854 TaxID=2760306 RepID=UPI0015FF0B2C|nr:DUF3987 domain-containing protein [Paracoccus sp. MC1854]MBB1493303.1 DUF3987 domain-containing protein [Paracoccus sp. MC1854]
MTNVHALSIPAPRPLVADARHAAPYPTHLLGPLRAAVEAAHRETQAPIAIAAQSALAAASLAVQGHANVETLGGYRPLSLYCITIAGSGERKSTVDRCLAGSLDDFDCTVSDPTVHGLFRILSRTPSAGLLSDEAGSFLGSYAMKPSQAQQTFGTFNSLWDGKRIRLARAKEETVLHGRRMALHLMMQPAVAEKLIGDPMAEGIGFLPRCLIVEPESTIGTRRITTFPESQPPAERSRERLVELLSKELPIREPETFELAPRRLPLSIEAREALVTAADEIERDQARGNKLESVRAFASKTAENACRIAGVLAMWRDPNADKVEAEDMESGLGLASYYLDEAQRLMGRSALDADLRMADELRIWLQSRPNRTFLTADVQQCAPRRDMLKRPVADRLLSTLEEHGWIRRLPTGALVDGAPRKAAWTLC